MEHEEHKDMPEKEEISPEMCMKAGKCMMMQMMGKMSKDEYDNMSDEEKDKTDEKEVMKEE